MCEVKQKKNAGEKKTTSHLHRPGQLTRAVFGDHSFVFKKITK